MTREQAISRVRKLRALTVARGATEAEAESAKAAASRLIAKFDLRHGDLVDTPLLPPPPSLVWEVFLQGFPTTTTGGTFQGNTFFFRL